MDPKLQKQVKEMFRKLPQETQTQLMSLQKTVREGIKDSENDVLKAKKCLNCPENASRKCNACKTAYFCSRECEKKSRKIHKKICEDNRGLEPETKIPFANNTIRLIVFSDIQNRNTCYLCETKDDLRLYHESVFCKNCLEY